MPAEEREGATRPLSEVVNDIMSSEAFLPYSGNERAARAWFRANGDFEHRHTRGVYLKETSRHGVAPVLVVYVDSKSIETDLRADKDIYLVRLAHYGFEVSDIVFKLSHKGAGVSYVPARTSRPSLPILPELSPAELAQVEVAVAQLDGTLREQVRKAMISSLRRDKSLDHKEL